MHEIISLPAVDDIRAALKAKGAKNVDKASDHFIMTDLAGYVDLMREHLAGDQTSPRDEKFRHDLEHGRLDLAEKTDSLLQKFEDHVFIGRGWQVVNDVCGATPDIGAYLAGHPYNMRRRARTTKETAPLSLFMEMTASSGAMDTINERGAAMLALTRLLSNVRPVELWLCITYGGASGTKKGTTGPVLKMIGCKIETTPLDVARAAAAMCQASLMAQTGYYLTKQINGGWEGGARGWAYGVPEIERRYAGEILRRIVSPGSLAVYVPAGMAGAAGDGAELLNNPEAWLRHMLKKYGGAAVADSEENAA